MRHRLARRAAHGHRRRLGRRACRSPTVIAGRSRPRARSAPRDGDLSLLDGHCGGDRARHQPLAGGARRGRDAQGAAQAGPGAEGDAAVAGAPPEPGGGDRSRRGGHAGGAGLLPPPERASASWWTSWCSGCWISSSWRSRSRAAGPATSPGDEARRVVGGDGRGRSSRDAATATTDSPRWTRASRRWSAAPTAPWKARSPGCASPRTGTVT